jgi:hypothetical protein
MRGEFPHSRIAVLALAVCILIYGAPILGAQPPGADVPAQASGAPVPHPALVFFSQHRLPEREWAALFAAVHANLPEAAAEVPALDAKAELIRGDALASGALVPQSVNVYLHGDCELGPELESFPGGARLGWVVKVGPQIEPVVHVECTAIGQELSESVRRMNRDERTAAMSEALARVILHEWAHIATQSSAHGSHGITKAQFGVKDLIPGSGQTEMRAQGLQ